MMNDLPDWYWKKGLHDAIIKQFAFQNIDFDYTKRNPIRNFLRIELDSSNALFDTKVTSIEFYNAKIVTNIVDVSGYWWDNDDLTYNKKKYTLVVHVRSRKEKSTIQISFDSAAVFRSHYLPWTCK